MVYFSYRPFQEVRQVETVFVWDLDKTYLDTKFETLKGLFQTFFEKPTEKKNVPGTAVLVKSLEDFWKKKHFGRDLPLYFVTASPPQLEPKIIEKLRYDGVKPFGLFCKDNLQNLKPKRFWRLMLQIGFKLQALLELRTHLSESVEQFLFGDDSESDAVIYSLYSDICSRRLDRSEIREILKAFHVLGDQIEVILDLQSKIPVHDPARKIYINLEADTDAEYYLKFGRRVLPTFNSFQIAMDLYQEKMLSIEHVVAVAKDLMENYGAIVDEMEQSLDGMIRRQVLGAPVVQELLKVLKENHIISDDFQPSVEPPEISQEPMEPSSEKEVLPPPHLRFEGVFEPWVPERIDYLQDYR
ncbi:MAG: hypothetical protein D6797_02935 [Bdellovibrio sp.]|nr:MAG: hypothetical protein D6797_02935 [Bdellovibrio sp.]